MIIKLIAVYSILILWEFYRRMTHIKGKKYVHTLYCSKVRYLHYPHVIKSTFISVDIVIINIGYLSWIWQDATVPVI